MRLFRWLKFNYNSHLLIGISFLLQDSSHEQFLVMVRTITKSFRFSLKPKIHSLYNVQLDPNSGRQMPVTYRKESEVTETIAICL